MWIPAGLENRSPARVVVRLDCSPPFRKAPPMVGNWP
jgi:hypothetical protein